MATTKLPPSRLAKHKKGLQAAIQVRSQHWMELESLPPKKSVKRRVIKGRV